MNGNKTIFAMSIENTSTKMQTYSVTAVKSASDCSNKTLRRQRNEANVDVLVSFSDNLKNVSVYPGQVTDFTVTITAPKGTEMNKWGCTKIIAATKDCAEADSVILSTYIATNQE
ncbi:MULTISPECIES: Fn3-like domain-containing protein [unclassified Winogradskyella]|uniref:Fn3-like domain-containing protein n=1 Tax=unclassified Winogradskyella TaxID=2615021 RepID=UPI0012F8CFB1|nr:MULTISPECIES: Fn3-like domain-containing protein [unclassified Winogradskyella]